MGQEWTWNILGQLVSRGMNVENVFDFCQYLGLETEDAIAHILAKILELEEIGQEEKILLGRKTLKILESFDNVDSGRLARRLCTMAYKTLDPYQLPLINFILAQLKRSV